jgi:hypothetical protein
MADETLYVGDVDKPAWTQEEWKEFERLREEQARAWDKEWRRYGTISGSKTVGQPAHLARRGRRARKGSRARTR